MILVEPLLRVLVLLARKKRERYIETTAAKFESPSTHLLNLLHISMIFVHH